ncbi:uncharacterized protein CC84DRAFT_1210830 [Paraphaeosphaeria sporulosa]|uniref:Uncharacterized protein n=1 Tax=Paraphaeosphaeria sporulosa TaxID=1460663 RepID=A0A177CUC9_9PLEO|nr:uncharacterized protein CC84DRAFT_1210830 [Paraphaeosphaeria sporulosa]OAG11155.1 hypothetical protein CC84DRAFT_1210830 [Paraphaeosphaeria sporulosa]
MSEAAPQPSAPAWRAFVHLYLPVITIAFLTLFLPNPFSHRALLLASALPTYFLASLVHQPRPGPAERFTRRSHIHHAIVLFTYGRLLGTPFNLFTYLEDLFASYSVRPILDRPEGAPPRPSEFFVQALWTTATTVAFGLVPPSWKWTWSIMGWTDRIMYRAAYLALVDDLVRVLGYPQVASKRGRALVVAVQAVFIAVSVMWVHFFLVLGMRAQIEKDIVMPMAS